MYAQFRLRRRHFLKWYVQSGFYLSDSYGLKHAIRAASDPKGGQCPFTLAGNGLIYGPLLNNIVPICMKHAHP
jgi:hypothetical protein